MSGENTRLRLSIVGVVVIALFSALFARLWYLQVAAGGSYAAAAQSNRIREIQTEAPRGRLLDRNGKVLIDNRIQRVVTMDRKLTTAQRVVSAQKLAPLLNMTADDILKKISDPRASQYKPVPVAVDVPFSTVQYISEHQEEFPGVSATSIPVRSYPNGPLGAHILGYSGEMNDAEYAKFKKQGYQLGDTIGKAGVERTFEADLRGKPGVERVEVDYSGKVVRTVGTEDPVPGSDVYLTLDLTIQQAAEAALAQGLAAAAATRDVADKTKWSQFNAPGGSIVVLDATDGSVVAMASAPTFDPSQFSNGIPSETWKQLNDPANHYPLTNRAIQGQYAPGSTFKLVTGVAGLQAGVVTPDLNIADNGKIQVGDREFSNSGGEANGQVDMAKALTVSSDVYFYRIGAELWKAGNRGVGDGEVIQQVARQFGFGSLTGIALEGEQKGRIPDAAWKKAVHKERPDAFPYEQWLPGDNVNLSVGQGDTLVTPLQLGEAYVAFLNGGKVFTPRLAGKIAAADGANPKALVSTTRMQAQLPTDGLAAMQAGFAGVVADGEGTAHPAFSGFPLNEYSVAGKTGTAQVAGKQDTSWFVAYSPAERPKYVVVAVLEESGFGASAAAPAVRHVLEAAYGIEQSGVRYSAPVGKHD